MDLLFAY
ncbi:hypothetical protein Patl1_01236 [Pistacia atlantica]|nr:hypothetical protein Patl1_01236 [Pistacia atlantica]